MPALVVGRGEAGVDHSEKKEKSEKNRRGIWRPAGQLCDMNQKLWLPQRHTVEQKEAVAPCPEGLWCARVGDSTWNTQPDASNSSSCNGHEGKLGVLLKMVVIPKPYFKMSLPHWSVNLIDVELFMAPLPSWEALFWGTNLLWSEAHLNVKPRPSCYLRRFMMTGAMSAMSKCLAHTSNNIGSVP